MTPRQQAYARAKELGAALSELRNGDIVEVCIVSPEGSHWIDSGTIELVWSASDGEPVADAWDDLLTRMMPGLEACNECCGHMEQA